MAMLSRRLLPFEPMDSLRRDFTDLMSRFLGPMRGGEAGLQPFGVDISDDADHLYIEADLPGFRKDEVEITLNNGLLTISAERREMRGDPPDEQPRPRRAGGNYLLRERQYERYHRSFTLPVSVDEEHVDARLEDGCLCITLNKTSESKPRRIPVS